MYVGAFLFDAIFHSIKEGKLTYGSITFLGGMVTAVITFYLVIKHLLPYHKRNILFFINRTNGKGWKKDDRWRNWGHD